MKHNSIHITRVLEGGEREQGIENLFEEILAENFSNPVEEKKHTCPGSSESPKQDEHEEPHTKTDHR